MNRPVSTKMIALAILGLMVASACGQKPGVADEPVPGFAAAGGLEGAQIDPETGGIIDPETGQIIDPETGEVIGTVGSSGAGGSTTSSGPSSSGTGSGGDGPGGDGGTQAEGPTSGGNATGVTNDTITIGIHAPITGAAPVNAPSFDKGKSLYFEFMKSQKKSLSGRSVRVVSRNDNYQPSQAVAVCKEMVEQEKAFLLFGVAGTDQIQACARYANSVQVPYLSGGVTEIGVDALPYYFAMWMSYKQQGPLLADMMTSKLGARGENNAMVRFNAPTFQDAHDAYLAGMKSAGASVGYDRAVSKNATASDAQNVATEMNQRQVDNAYVLTSPTWFIQLAQAAVNQGYKPTYTGVGLSMGIDTVANVACRNNSSIDGARFLNPFPAYVDSNKFDPDFRRAGGSDDIMFGLWGATKVIWQLLSLPGKDLTRERFVYFAERAPTIKTGVLPDIKYSPTNHFGGTAMHLIRADCGQGRWVTEESFKSQF
jgi:branched-chain amino acid transport system substrate-binding protein